MATMEVGGYNEGKRIALGFRIELPEVSFLERAFGNDLQVSTIAIVAVEDLTIQQPDRFLQFVGLDVRT
jgi:hypothetical protein